jgi:hypothetical protein
VFRACHPLEPLPPRFSARRSAQFARHALAIDSSIVAHVETPSSGTSGPLSQENVMQRTLITLFTATLLATAISASAQTTDQAAQPTGEQTNHKDPADPSKGQDLVNPKATKADPTTIGQDKSTGNNLVEPKMKGQMGMAARPDFKMLDTKNHGYVMASEVNNPWVKENFSKCDKDGDGKLTKSEYQICAKQ